MQSMQSIRRRIQGINSTKQITNSMRLVATSKVKRSRDHLEKTREFTQAATDFIEALSHSSYPLGKSRYFEPSEISATGILIISSDRGLCGGYNMNVARVATQLVRESQKTKVISVGTRIADSFRREETSIDIKYLGLSETPLYAEAEMVADRALELYDSGDIDELYIVYTRFISMLQQQASYKRLLPYPVEQKQAGSQKSEWLFEPKPEEVIRRAVTNYVSGEVFAAMAESAASEQSARVTSMDAASKNSDELITKLTLSYNQLRQGKITREISEIVSGASAVDK